MLKLRRVNYNDERGGQKEIFGE